MGASVATANIESNTSSFLGDNSRIASGKDIVINSLSHIGSSSLLSFIGTGSFAYQASTKAMMVANQAETEANKANTYTDSAKFGNNHNTGTIFNDSI